MPLLRNMTSGLRSLFRKEQVDRELDEELRAYQEMAAEEKMKDGMTRKEALRAVRLERGSLEVSKEIVRSGGWEFFIETCWQDLRYAIRTLRKSPGFTAAVVLTLTLAIGANTAIFTLTDAVMLKSLPVANPGQLYRLGDNNSCCVMVGTQNGGRFVFFSYPLYQSLRDHTPEFTGLAAFASHLSDLSVRRGGDSAAAQPYKGEFVSGNYFEMFGISAFAGRTLTAKDDIAGAPPAAVISYHTWQTHFASDPSVIGASFVIDTLPYTIVGVAPARFYGDTLRSDPPDFWLPLATDPDRWLFATGPEWLYLIGRLRPGAATAEVQARLTVELQQWLWSTGYSEAAPEQRNDQALVAKYRQEIRRQHI